VADLHDQSVVAKRFQQALQARQMLGRMVKRKRELEQNGAQPSRALQYVKAPADGLGVFGRRSLLVRESLPELGGEKKSRICSDAAKPLRGNPGLERAVKRRVDLDRIEKLGQIPGFVKAARAPRRVDDPVPVGVGPPRRTDENPAGLGGVDRDFMRHQRPLKAFVGSVGCLSLGVNSRAFAGPRGVWVTPRAGVRKRYWEGLATPRLSALS
jgi:hypothetical protein